MELKIYNIADALMQAANAITVDEETGEIVGQEAFDAMLAEGQDKVLDAARYLRTRSFDLKAMEEVAHDLNARIRAEKKRQEWLNERILDAMEAFGVQKIEAPDVCLKVAKKPASVEIFDEDQIPGRYIKTVLEPSKSSIKEALKRGEDVPGACLKYGFRLSIK